MVGGQISSHYSVLGDCCYFHCDSGHCYLNGLGKSTIFWFDKCRDSLSQSVMKAQWGNEWISLSVLSVARVMIAQWENEWISLSVLSLTRVMIAQWDNECISLSVLSVARVMIAQWESECISLSGLSMVRVMIAQWENECISLSVLSVARVMVALVYLLQPWQNFFSSRSYHD